MYEVIRQVHAPDLNMSAKWLLAVLASYADEKERKCWPSIEELAVDMQCDRKTVVSAKKRLSALGLIGARYVRGKGTVYTLPEFEKTEKEKAWYKTEEEAAE